MTLAQAFAKGWTESEIVSSRQRGFFDGLQGKLAPRDSDNLHDYLDGHADGITERACCVGCAPTCKAGDES